jgi:hypothetical protein
MRQCGLTQPWWAIEQNVVERLTTLFRRVDGDEQVLFYLVLPDEVCHSPRAEIGIQRTVFNGGFSGNYTCDVYLLNYELSLRV